MLLSGVGPGFVGRVGVCGLALCAFLLALPANALDLSIDNTPAPGNLTTPQIDNLGTLKRFHLKDIEVAQPLQVSCYVRGIVVCNGDPINTICEALPPAVAVRFSLVDATGTVYTSVNVVHVATWSGYLFDPSIEFHRTQVSSVNLPLAGLDLPNIEYFVRATVDPNNVIVESNETNNARESDDSFFYRIYSGALHYGPIETQLTSLIAAGFFCACIPPCPPLFPLSDLSTAEWTHEWGTSEFNPNDSCYTGVLNADGFSYDLVTPAATAPASIGTISGTTPSGIVGELRNVTLDANGAHHSGGAFFTPDTVTVHDLINPGNLEDGFHPCGRQRIDFFGIRDFIEIYDLATFTANTRRMYHGYGLPFHLIADSASFNLGDANGIQLATVSAMHVHYPSYVNLNPKDPRGPSLQRKGFPSNDVVFMGYDGSPIAGAEIASDGIVAAGLNFKERNSVLSTARTSFPQGRIAWNQPFQSSVVDNTLIPQALPVTSYQMRARQTCPDDNCGEYEAPESYSVALDGSDVWMTEDGGMGSPFTALGDLTEWGKWDAGNPTFRRDDGALSGVFYMPGWVMPKTADESMRTAAQVLLGSRLFDGAGGVPNTLSVLKGTNSNAHRGNGFYAGLTMGPERLETLDELAGEFLINNLAIRFNGNAGYDQFQITPYTKYVLRPSGVTGVFNTTFMGVLNIYGYDIDFRRFAFRQVYNKLDGKTWLDGTLDIPYPADITVTFLELDLLCSGDLGSGEVDTEPESDWMNPDGVDNDGDTFIDEGNQVLSYWRTPISITGMAFVPTAMSGDACLDNENKELQLITLNNNNGIEQFLTMTSIYPVDGRLKDQKLTSSAENTFDKPQGSSEEGFAVRLEKAYLNQRASYPAQMEGFLNLTGLTDVPLFNDLELALHLDNPEPDGLALPDDTFEINVFRDESDDDANFNGIPDTYGQNATNNVSSYRDLLANIEDAPEPGDPRPRAKYQWPSSGLVKLDYALNYNRSDGMGMPQFLGVQKTYDLVGEAVPVITIKSVPDYINPLRTKFSFGVSADFAAIANFQVNLNDLGDIDDFLHNFLGVDPSFSLENIFSNVLDAENFVKDITGGDLTQLLAPLVDAALNAGPVDSALEDFADAIGVVNRIPQEISVRAGGVMDELKGQLLAELTGGVEPLAGGASQLQSIFDQYAAYLAAPPDIVNNLGMYPGNPFNTPVLQQEVADAFEQINDALDQVEDVLEEVHAGVGTAKTELAGLTGDLNDALTDVQALFMSIKTTILDPAGALGEFTGLANNPIIQEVDKVKDTLQDVLDAIKSVPIGQIGDVIQTAAGAVGSDIDLSLLDDVENTIDSFISSVEEIVDQAEMLLEGQYGAMPTVFNDAEVLLDQIIAILIGLQTEMNNVDSFIEGYLDQADEQIGLFKGFVQSLRELLTSDLPIPDAGELPTYNDLVSYGQDKLNDFARQMVDSLVDQIPAGLLYNELIDLQSQISMTPAQGYKLAVSEGFATLICLPLEQAVGEVTSELAAIIEDALSVIPTPDAEDIKQIIRNAILNSDPVLELNEAFFDLMSPVTDAIDEVATTLTSGINNLIQQGIEAISEGINSAIDSVTSAIADFDLVGGRLDGFAIVNQQEIEQIHIEAEFTFGGDPDPTTYFAALDITAWNSENGKGACVADAAGLIDAVISTRDISAAMLGADIGIKEAALGFTLDEGIPIGVFGRIYTSGELNFQALIIRDIGLEFGMGLIENYVGATAAGRFESYTFPKVAFYFGLTCDFGVLERLDPEVAEFVGEMVPLAGIYVRGSVEVPIYNVGCFFKVGVGADVGAWFFTGAYGGLIGGSAYGQIGCLASLKGKVTVLGQKKGDEFQFSGNGWAGAGIGFCSPEDWATIADVRDDDWCVTGDASFGATYKGGWSIDGPSVNCCD